MIDLATPTLDLEVQEYILRELPHVLEKNERFVFLVEGIVSDKFPHRDEFARLLDEVAQLRIEMNRRFEEQREETHRRFEAQQNQITELRIEMNRRFEAQQNQITELRIEMNRRFEAQQNQITELRIEMNRRFEQVDRRFEQVDRRFEEHHQEILYIKKDIHQLKSAVQSLDHRMEGMEKWWKVTSGALRAEKGHSMEELFAAGLRYGLQDPDILAEHVRLQQILTDSEGAVFHMGYKTEVDVIARNGELLVFEIKSTYKQGDAGFFSLKVRLLQSQNQAKQVKGVFVCIGADEPIRVECEQYGLRLVD